MLPAGKHVISVWTDVIPSITKGALIIDCSTIDVESAKAAHALAAKHGLASVDAPVSGGTGAPRVRRYLMCGGEDKAFEPAKPVLENMGKKLVHCAVSRRGRRQKSATTMMLAISMIGSRGFVLAEKLGLSHQALFESPRPRRGNGALRPIARCRARCRPRPPTTATSPALPRR